MSVKICTCICLGMVNSQMHHLYPHSTPQDPSIYIVSLRSGCCSNILFRFLKAWLWSSLHSSQTLTCISPYFSCAPFGFLDKTFFFFYLDQLVLLRSSCYSVGVGKCELWQKLLDMVQKNIWLLSDFIWEFIMQSTSDDNNPNLELWLA